MSLKDYTDTKKKKKNQVDRTNSATREEEAEVIESHEPV